MEKKEFLKKTTSFRINPIINTTKVIDDGSIVCDKIKEIYHPEKLWKDCFKEVALIFTAIKKKLRPHFICDSEDEFIESLSNYTNEDLKNIYESS